MINDRVATDASRSPYSIALVVPTACDAAPKDQPRAIGDVMLNSLKIGGAIKIPNTPVNTTITTVKFLIPPRLSEIAIAIGVVTDLGMMVAIISSVVCRIKTIPIMVTACTITPTIKTLIIVFQCFFNIGSFSYKGSASDTVAGPMKNEIILVPS